MKQDKQKILFMLGAFCIITGIIIAKISSAMANNEHDNTTFVVIGLFITSVGTLFISANIIMRLIKHSKAIKAAKK